MVSRLTVCGVAIVILALLSLVGIRLRRARLDGALAQAVMANDATAVRRLLGDGANPNAIAVTPLSRPKPAPILSYAASYDGAAVVAALLDAGARIDAPDPAGATPLADALHTGSPSTAELLLRRGARAGGQPNRPGPLDLAFASMDSGMPLAVLRSGIPLSQADLDNALRQARTPDVALALLRRGAYAAAPNPSGVTAIARACQPGRTAVLAALLASGVAIPRSSLQDALVAASAAGDARLTQLLIRRGARPGVTPPRDGSPVQAAAACGSAAVVRILLAAGASVRASAGGEALIAACSRCTLRVTRELLDAGADANYQDRRGRTPLEVAALSGRDDLCTLLLQRRARASGIAGGQALAAAAFTGDTRLEIRLLKLGADPDRLDLRGWSPLMDAAVHGDLAAARVLIQCGANVDARSPDGPTALYLAERSAGARSRQFCSLLRAAGARNDRPTWPKASSSRPRWGVASPMAGAPRP